MTPEQMRVKIFEKVKGIKPIYRQSIKDGDRMGLEYWDWYDGADSGMGSVVIPNYCNDLNAIHEAEKVLDKVHNGWSEYADILETVCGSDGWPIMSELDKRKIIHTTAQQRAEAFCRVFWPEEFTKPNEKD